ncbi:MAG TPA: hypothetical protein ENJ41_00015 [Oceanospirillales bacterium]|nr:hypothetical protein [Oceanospirillales bacterium]
MKLTPFINYLGQPKVLMVNTAFVIVMFIAVMFVINPIIDGSNGVGLIDLQLSFDKTAAIGIVQSWGEQGVYRFNRWIFSDYIYALSYGLFFASLLSYLLSKKNLLSHSTYKFVVFIPFIAALLDWLEDSLELLFINNQTAFSASLFFSHSLIATMKFAFIGLTLLFLLIIWRK